MGLYWIDHSRLITVINGIQEDLLEEEKGEICYNYISIPITLTFTYCYRVCPKYMDIRRMSCLS